jgi:hypothetical protein
MKVKIEDKRILIGGKPLEYDSYFFAIWGGSKSEHLPAVKSVLAQWVTALTSLREEGRPVYLPYYLSDQWCKYLKAELTDKDMLLTEVFVRRGGYAMNLGDLSRDMYSEPTLMKSFIDPNGYFIDFEPKFFGRYKAEELIEALRDAEIASA